MCWRLSGCDAWPVDEEDEHERWWLYLRKLESGEDLRGEVAVEPDRHVALSLVLKAFEIVPAADRRSWVDALPADNRDYAARRLAEFAVLEGLDPDAVAEFHDWTDWLQLRVAGSCAPGPLLEALARHGRTKRVRGLASSRLRAGRT